MNRLLPADVDSVVVASVVDVLLVAENTPETPPIYGKKLKKNFKNV